MTPHTSLRVRTPNAKSEQRQSVRRVCVVFLARKKHLVFDAKCLILLGILVGTEGLEPSTTGLRVRCSTN